jgi:hypothetical protein
MTTHDTPEAALAAALRPIVSREACFNPSWPEGWAERSAAAILAALDGWTLVPVGTRWHHSPDAERLRWAEWIVSWAREADWACAECRPDSDMLVDGFVCVYHEARAALAPTGEER